MLMTRQKLTFEEYLIYDDGTETRYELIDGYLAAMPPPRIRHQLIVRFLELLVEAEIKGKNLPWLTLHNIGVRTGLSTSRCPDLCVVNIEQIEVIKDLSGVLETPPLLVIEVVSPSSVDDDYMTKPNEYQAKEIPEYWVVDAISDDPRITIHTLQDGVYQVQVFRDTELLISSTFPKLQITAEAILNS